MQIYKYVHTCVCMRCKARKPSPASPKSTATRSQHFPPNGDTTRAVEKRGERLRHKKTNSNPISLTAQNEKNRRRISKDRNAAGPSRKPADKKPPGEWTVWSGVELVGQWMLRWVSSE